MDKKKVVIGFPRSGTGTMAKYYDLGHERWNDNGTSDWRLAFKLKDRDQYELVHVIRNPVDVISSNLFTMGYKSFELIKNNINTEYKSIICVLVKGLIEWNRQIESLKPDKTIKIESLKPRFNGRRHPKLGWGDLGFLPLDLFQELTDMAIKYGYRPNY